MTRNLVCSGRYNVTFKSRAYSQISSLEVLISKPSMLSSTLTSLELPNRISTECESLKYGHR